VETFGEKAKLSMPPARQSAILTCMDARLDPAKFAGLSEVTLTSFAMQAEEQARTRFVPS
jgi:hypothetical protein